MRYWATQKYREDMPVLVKLRAKDTEIADLAQEISAASSEQSTSVSQINTAMEQVNQITQQNAGP